MIPDISILIILSLSFGNSYIIDSSRKSSATSPTFVKETLSISNSSLDKTKDLSEFPKNVPSYTQKQAQDNISLHPWRLGHSANTEQFVSNFPRNVINPSLNDIRLSTVLNVSNKNKNYVGKSDELPNNNISLGVKHSTVNGLKSVQQGDADSQQRLTDFLMNTVNTQSSSTVPISVHPEFQLARMFRRPRQEKFLLTRKQRHVVNPSTTSSSFPFSKLRFNAPYFLNPTKKTDRLNYFPNHQRDMSPNFKSMMLLSPVTFFHQKRSNGAPGRAGHRQPPVPSELIIKKTKSIPVYQTARGLHKRRRYDVPQIECPPTADGSERFSCPSPDHMGRYKCILDHAMCDGFIDCPNEEDEDRMSCMFFQTTKAHLDVLADALLRWARGRY